MIKHPKNGWAELTVGNHTERVSYITDVLEDIIDSAKEFLKNKKLPISIPFDPEGWCLKFIIDEWETILLTDIESDERTEPYLAFTCDKCAKDVFIELLSDIKEELHDWVYNFEIWQDIDPCDGTEEEYQVKEMEMSKEIDVLLKKLKNLL